MGESQKYTVEDLLVDDRFLEWIHSNERQHNQYWQDQLLNQPHLSTVIREAKEIALALSAPKKQTDPTFALQELEAAINQQKSNQPKRIWLKNWTIAATIALLFTLTWSFWPQSQSFQTAFGEIQTITLPDGTSVTLRANSKLWWEGDWKQGDSRTVFLEGEAYFDVRPTNELQNDRSFIVKALPLEIKVLGTEFNIVNRPNRTNIVLIEGKVAIKTNNHQQYQLKPHEQYTWNTTKKSGNIENVNTALFTDWRQYIWHFDNTTLSDVAILIEQHFGKKVLFDNPLLKDRKLNGSAPSSSLKTLLNGLKSSLNISIINQGDHIIIAN